MLLDLLVSLVKQPFLFAELKREQGMHGEVQVWDLPYFVRDDYRFLPLWCQKGKVFASINTPFPSK